jgi:hypothetical protein
MGTSWKNSGYWPLEIREYAIRAKKRAEIGPGLEKAKAPRRNPVRPPPEGLPSCIEYVGFGKITLKKGFCQARPP